MASGSGLISKHNDDSMKKIELWEQHVNILVTLVTREIAHMAQIKAEFKEKDIDCGGVNTQVDRLQTILRTLTNETD